MIYAAHWCKNKITLFVLAALLFELILSAFYACASIPEKTFSEAEVAAVREYSDPATETTLQGLSENNIDKYSRYFNEKMKAAVTDDLFNKTASQLNNQIGTYVSKEFLRVGEQGEYLIVHYSAKYSRGQVGIRMVFDRDHLIAGQWFE